MRWLALGTVPWTCAAREAAGREMALLLHPGDREPSSLELAILRGQHIWGSDFNSKCYRSAAAFHPLTASDNTQQVLRCSRNSVLINAGHFPDTRCKLQQTSVLCSIPLARVPTERASPQPLKKAVLPRRDTRNGAAFCCGSHEGQTRLNAEP